MDDSPIIPPAYGVAPKWKAHVVSIKIEDAKPVDHQAAARISEIVDVQLEACKIHLREEGWDV
jgi:hypothetical protein